MKSILKTTVGLAMLLSAAVLTTSPAVATTPSPSWGVAYLFPMPGAGSQGFQSCESGGANCVVFADPQHVWTASGPSSVTPETSKVIEFDEATRQNVSPGLKVPGSVQSIVSDGTDLWVGSSILATKAGQSDVGYLSEFNITSRQLVRPALSVGALPLICSSGSVIWSMSNDFSNVVEIDAATGTKIRTLTNPGGAYLNPSTMTCDTNGIWVFNQNRVLEKIDNSTGNVGTTIPLPGTSYPSSLALVGGNLWVTTVASTNNLMGFDATTGTQVGTPISAGVAPWLLSGSGPDLWLRVGQQDSLAQLDPLTGAALSSSVNLGDVPAQTSRVGSQTWVVTPSTVYLLGATVGAVVLTPASTLAPGSGSWSVGFTSSATGALSGDGADAITLGLPAGFTTPSPPAATLDTGFIGTCANPTTTSLLSGSLTIKLPAGCSLGASTSATATISDITNVQAGAYQPTAFSVSTTQDLALASPLSGVTITPYVAPGAPTHVTATGENGQAFIAWTPPALNGAPEITSYDVSAFDPSQTLAGTCSSVDGPPPTNSCTVTGLTNGTAYSFRVSATNVVGVSPSSAATSPVTPTIKPSPPVSLAITPNAGQATFTWQPPLSDGGQTITRYEVTSTTGSKACTWTTGPLTCTISGLASGARYVFTINATNSAGTGVSSGTKAITMPLYGVNVLSYGQYAPAAVTFGGTSMWVVDSGSVAQINDLTGSLVRTITGPADNFVEPQSISSDNQHIWVADTNNNPNNGTGNAVTELDASTGALVQVLKGGAYGFNYPSAISSDGTSVWVTNILGNSVTELSASTGAKTRVIKSPSDGFNNPSAIYSDGVDVWVANANSITELSAATGQRLKLLNWSYYGINQPTSITSDGTNLWVANLGSVSEINEATGALVNLLEDPAYGFNYPGELAFDGKHVWVVNQGPRGGPGSVTEIKASNGFLVKVLKGSPYRFNDPVAIAFDGAKLWVTNEGTNTVTEFPSSI